MKFKKVLYYLYKCHRSFLIHIPLLRNKILCYINDIKIGNKAKMYGYIYFLVEKKGKVTIGDNLIFTSGLAMNPLSRNIRGCIRCANNASITIGNNVGLSSTCIWAQKQITIGNNVKIGGDTILIDSDAHSLDFILRRNTKEDNINKKNMSITIEDDVLIGTRCIILKGVTIGARSIIGAGSVVTKSIPSDCIAAGNPCKIIKYINK